MLSKALPVSCPLLSDNKLHKQEREPIKEPIFVPTLLLLNDLMIFIYERIQYGYINHVSTTFAYSTHQVSSQILLSKRFPRFPVSLSNSPQCQQIWSGFEIRALRHEFLLNIKFHQDPVTGSQVKNTSIFLIFPH